MSAFFAETKLKLVSSGSSLPGEPVDNQNLFEQLEQHCDKKTARKARMIAHRLGIEQRFVARDFSVTDKNIGIDAPELCAQALQNACTSADTKLGVNDYLIGHTTTPYTLLPPNISWVADKMQHHGPYLELRQACTGFANGLQIASAMLHANPSLAKVAIVGSEVGSRYCEITPNFLDQEQLVNYVQMGDGAGAVILAAHSHPSPHVISDIYLGQIGVDKLPGFELQGGGSHDPRCEKGFPYFKHRVHQVREQGAELFQLGVDAILARGYQLSDFSYILPHQVNGHVAKLLAQYLDVAEDKIINEAKFLGNMGSAAIWVCLDRLRRSGKLKTGDKVLVLGAEATKYLYGGFVYQH